MSQISGAIDGRSACWPSRQFKTCDKAGCDRLMPAGEVRLSIESTERLRPQGDHGT